MVVEFKAGTGLGIRFSYLLRRLESRSVEVATGCWLWGGYMTSLGYGQTSCVGFMGKKQEYVHRLAYLLCVGEVPEDCEVCHRCDVRNCVNPAHLFVATHGENLRDAFVKGRLTLPDCKGEKSSFAKLTDAQALEIRRRGVDRVIWNVLAEEYGVTRGTIRRIMTGRTFKHLLAP